MLGLSVLFWWTLPVHAFHTWKKELLPNGMTLVVVEKADVPAVSLTLLVRHGATSEPADKKGVAALTAQLLMEGTRQRSGDQIAERIAALGGQFAADTGFDDTTIDWTVLKPDLAQALEILADVVQRPVFPPEAVERKRTATLAEHRGKAGAVLHTVLLQSLLRDSAYGIPTWGETSMLARVAREDIVQFYRHAYRPEDTILAAAGNVTFEEFVATAKKYLGGWPGVQTVERVSSILSVKPAPGAVVVDRPLAQATLYLAFVGASTVDPDTPALDLLTHLLADGPESRLGRLLREQHGWTYTVRSDLASFRQTGVFFIDMSVPYEAVIPALEQTVRELVCLQSTGPSAAELARVKQQAAVQFYFTTEDLPDLSRFIAKHAAFNPEHEPPERLLAALDRVTRDEVQAVARRYLNPQKAVVGIEGDRAALQKVAPNVVAGSAPQWPAQCEGQGETVR
jgi:zinc protease